jgi:hypothetical protein
VNEALKNLEADAPEKRASMKIAYNHSKRALARFLTYTKVLLSKTLRSGS